jgi:hypothetical protein
MKKITCSMIFLTVILVLAVSAQAGDNLSLVVSATIPLIPGVNAPLIEEESVQPLDAEDPQETISQQTDQVEQENQLAGNSEKPLMLVKTIYDR